MYILFLDTETTGFNHFTNDMWQIAGFITNNNDVVDKFDLKCQPKNWYNISPDALATCNMTVEKLKTFERPEISFNQLYNIIEKNYNNLGKAIVAGQNVKSFDVRFVKAFWNKYKSPEQQPYETFFNTDIVFDLMDLSRPLKKSGLMKLENVKLGTIIEALDIKINGSLHDALTDIEATYNCFYELINRWKVILKNDMTKQKLLSENIKYLLEHIIVPEDNSDML
jgi:DNA polymerase III alpha subunit (gram-positive type)